MEFDRDTEPRQFPKVSTIQLDCDTQPVILSVKTGRKDLRAIQLAEARKAAGTGNFLSKQIKIV